MWKAEGSELQDLNTAPAPSLRRCGNWHKLPSPSEPRCPLPSRENFLASCTGGLGSEIASSRFYSGDTRGGSLLGMASRPL